MPFAVALLVGIYNLQDFANLRPVKYVRQNHIGNPDIGNQDYKTALLYLFTNVPTSLLEISRMLNTTFGINYAW